MNEEAQDLRKKMADKAKCEVKLESNSELGFFFRVTLKVIILYKLFLK